MSSESCRVRERILTSERKTSRSDSFRVYFASTSIAHSIPPKKVESRKYIIASSPPTRRSLLDLTMKNELKSNSRRLVFRTQKFSANACNSLQLQLLLYRSLCGVCGVILDNLYFALNRLSSRHNNKTALMINELIWAKRAQVKSCNVYWS
jgi:hypothetical protein